MSDDINSLRNSINTLVAGTLSTGQIDFQSIYSVLTTMSARGTKGTYGYPHPNNYSGTRDMNDMWTWWNAASYNCNCNCATNCSCMCPAADMFIRPELRAGEVKVRMLLEGVTDDQNSTRLWEVLTRSNHRKPCVRVIAENGAECEWRDITPFVQPDGSWIQAKDMLGHEILTDIGNGLEWTRCVALEDVGVKAIASISLGGHIYRAGKVPGKWMYAHNKVEC